MTPRNELFIFIARPQEFQIIYVEILDTLTGKSDVFHTVEHVHSCHSVFVSQVHPHKVNCKIMGLGIYKRNTKYFGNRNSVC
jgi:hypothetical protein